MLKRTMMTVALLAGPPVNAQAPRFDPGHMKPAPGPANQVLVLGSTHLSGMSKTWSPTTLGPLLDRLAAWQPELITIEALSGPQCEFMARYKHRYGSTVDDYCKDASAAQHATGLDMVAATNEIDRLFANWPSSPTPAQRRHLAALFMAAGEESSAFVQWLRLPVAERHIGDGLDATLVARLTTLMTKRDESIQIAAVLAARLGLERVYPTDDHTADDDPRTNDAAYGPTIQRLWNNPATDKRTRDDTALEANADTGTGMLALYRAYNAPGIPQLTYDSDFGAALSDTSPERYGRRYVGAWETRNLRMAANIRSVLAAHPGKRLLTVVGASHKAYFEAYLSMMHDVRIVPTDTVLK